DGVIDREGVGGLAQRLAVSERHLHRVLVAELGAGPLALARTRRAQTARLLIETTPLPFTEIAFAAGFASIRQFNDTVREVFGANPTVLRSDRSTAIRRARGGAPHPATSRGDVGHDGRDSPTLPATQPAVGVVPISLRLAARSPFAGAEVLAFLGLRAIPGVEAYDGDGTYRRVLRLPHGAATVALSAAEDHVEATMRLTDLRDLGPAVERCRRLLDLDADPASVGDVLRHDPVLEPLVAATPGRRSPGAIDGAEALVRAIVGQQVSVTGARTVAGRIALASGEMLPPGLAAPTEALGTNTTDAGALVRAFPSADALAARDPTTLAMPRGRAQALVDTLAMVADGRLVLDPGADRAEVEARLLSVKGVGPWTAAYVAMRALGDPDVFLPTDLGVLRGLAAVGLPPTPKAATERASAWRPWRSYALHHLWAAALG
ncbi:MAG: AlkA N-terminal domain-containing protein, partial [Acidimicrobiales bacterium]